MIEQTISIVAAFIILAAYAGQQAGKLQPNSVPYILLNLVGAIVLGVIALRAKQIGLTILELAWGAISAISLVRELRSR